MTGYGRGESDSGIGNCAVEINSCNHRYCDISIHMPRRFTIFENSLRSFIKERFSRGHFDVFISLELNKNLTARLNVDYHLIEDYVKALQEMKEKYRLSGDLDIQTVSRLRDIWKLEEDDYEEEPIGQLIEKAVKEALTSLEEMRVKEGEALYRDIVKRIELVRDHLQQLKKELPDLSEKYRTRLQEKIRDFLGDLSVDEQRVAQEVAIMGEKSDVTEEVTRMESHLEQFLSLIESREAIGRKLDFLIQEINREINTISSKISDLFVSNTVVAIKSELEKIREQIQNIE
jgi:uncharacterized protein (TIGR00255 family)